MTRPGGSKGHRSAASLDIPDVYRDMLAAATSSPMQSDDDGRSIKKRRVGGRIVNTSDVHSSIVIKDHSGKTEHYNSIDDRFEDGIPITQQIVETSSEDSADSDVNWEEVHLHDVDGIGELLSSRDSVPQKLNLTLDDGRERVARNITPKRKPLTAAEKKLRLDVHKMHLCSLMVHVYFRNHWCNDEDMHSGLRKMLTRKTVSYLNPDQTQSQFQRSRSFMDGLQQASDAFRARFKITARGMARSSWATVDASRNFQKQIPNDIDLPIQKQDFLAAAKDLRASRDVGAQLFCALLRAAGVETRLLCSFQPLPFQAGERPPLPASRYAATVSSAPGSRHTTPDKEFSTVSGSEDMVHGHVPIGSRGGRNRFASNQEPAAESDSLEDPKESSKKPIRESRYPVYWIEAFNESVQKWIPIDPLVTQSIAKASKFEPPAGERENNLSYVIAFEDDGSAYDVTRRYAKAYNAKTRRARVETTLGGERWWRRMMRVYQRQHRLDRDQLEDAELTAKEAAEPMPRNAQDFKNHPYYALERHMRRNEVIHPRREVGKLGVGKGHNASTLEPIYRRNDVLIVQSADKWYRKGRKIKPGEQAIKRVASRKVREPSMNSDDAMDEDSAGTALYAFHQTAQYEAPPVVNGRMTKNAYGNLDVYVPSMIPQGALHVRHPETARVARLLGIDYADAVTGFSFRGRHGTAVIQGAIIAVEHADAVREVLSTFEDERMHLEEERRSAQALSMWRRLLLGLRIRERIDGYDVEGERGAAHGEEDEVANDDQASNEDGGGFLPDRDGAPLAQPTANSDLFSTQSINNEATGADFGMIECVQSPQHSRDPFIDNFEEDTGGGFLVDDDESERPKSARRASRPVAMHFINKGTTEKTSQNDGYKMSTIGPLEGDPGVDDSGGGSLKRDSIIEGHESLREENEMMLGLSREQIQEGQIMEQLYASGSVNTMPTRPLPDTSSTPTIQAHKGERNSPPSSKAPLEPQEAASVLQNMDHETTADPVDDSEEEKGSLLSHDSDEEDVEPEWLA